MEQALSDALADYLARRAQGESPHPDEYRERAAGQYREFLELLAAESVLDVALGLEATALPCAFGRYILLAELGRGAMGVVYEARDDDRAVALKVLRTGLDTTREAVERFRREAEATRQVRHGHIVEVYEAGEVDGRPFYAMELVRGKSLAGLVREGRLPPPRELCGRFAELADALHALHENGLVHRDVKPSNILVEPDGRMVLGDFGLVRTLAAETLTRTGEALGTPGYMSPEQLRGTREEIDRRSDVYGLGATLYDALAGRPMFRADSTEALVQKVLLERPRPLRQVAPEASLDCERVVMTAVEKRREDRYDSAASMARDLRAVAGGKSVRGRPVSRVRRRARWARRRWRPLALALVATLALLLWYLNRPAMLTVRCYPEAEVRVDGEPRGTTPQVLQVAAGRHELTLRSGGFLEQKRTLELGAGEKRTLELVLIADDPEDPEALRKLAARFDLAIAELKKVRRERGPAGGVFPVFPRGRVRAKDLENYRIDVGPQFAGSGTLEFRMDGEVIESLPFEPLTVSTSARMPARVREAAAVGRELSWGYFPDTGEPVTARFVVARDPAELATLEKSLDEQDARVVAILRANLFLKHGLHTAAFREAEAHPRSALACAVMAGALERLGLEATPAWQELIDRVDALD